MGAVRGVRKARPPFLQHIDAAAERRDIRQTIGDGIVVLLGQRFRAVELRGKPARRGIRGIVGGRLAERELKSRERRRAPRARLPACSSVAASPSAAWSPDAGSARRWRAPACNSDDRAIEHAGRAGRGGGVQEDVGGTVAVSCEMPSSAAWRSPRVQPCADGFAKAEGGQQRLAHSHLGASCPRFL